MNLYKWTVQVLSESYDKRPTVRLIILYRALHECSLKQAKDLVEDMYACDVGGRINIEFFVDDTALGRLTYAVQGRNTLYTRPHIERVTSNVSDFNIVGLTHP